MGCYPLRKDQAAICDGLHTWERGVRLIARIVGFRRQSLLEFLRNRNKVERLVSSGLIFNRRRDSEWARSIILLS